MGVTDGIVSAKTGVVTRTIAIILKKSEEVVIRIFI